MDVVVGHFAYMEYASGSAHASHFPRKLVSYAREIVGRTAKTATTMRQYQAQSSSVESTFPGVSDPFLDFLLPEVRYSSILLDYVH